jgi:hypothetical protein
MNVHVNVKQPLSDMLGFSKTNGPTELEISITSGTNLKDLLEQISIIHPVFLTFTDPKINRLNDILIVVDGVVVIGAELDNIALHDQSIVSLLGRYKGG